jgi:hypothetical protein
MPERSEAELSGSSGDIDHMQSRNDWRTEARTVQGGVEAGAGGVGGKNEGGTSSLNSSVAFCGSHDALTCTVLYRRLRRLSGKTTLVRLAVATTEHQKRPGVLHRFASSAKSIN